MKRLTTALAACLLFAGLGSVQAKTPPKPFKLGALLDMGSLYADVTGPGSALAAEMAIHDFGGKVLGRPIVFTAVDHQNKPDVAAAIATKWFDEDHYEAILDVAASPPALAVMNVAGKRHKIVMLNGPGADSITDEACNAYTVQYTYDTYATSHAVTKAVMAQGKKSWFYLTADYTFGHQLQQVSADEVRAGGGKVLGNVNAPMNTSDFSTYLLQAQQSGAQVLGLANAGTDLINAVKQAHEFGLTKSGMILASMGAEINDIHGIGLESTQGMMVVDGFYWNANAQTRAFAKRFYAKLHKMPNMLQAGMYSSTMHYLEAVQAAGTANSDAVMKKMREMPINDFFAHNGHIRKDGLMVHDMYLFQVKTPAESKGPWDLYKLVTKIPGDQAFPSLAASHCPLITHKK